MVRFLFICLVFFVFGASAKADPGCELQRLLSIESKPDRGRHLLMPVTLMDRDTHLLLDTGGAWSMMNESFAKSLQLPIRQYRGEIQFYDAVGGRISSYVSVPSMKISGVQLKHAADFLVIARGDMPGYVRDAGTMGMNFFSKLDIEIDNAKRTIALFLQRDCEGGGVHWADESTWFSFRWDGGIPVARMQIDSED